MPKGGTPVCCYPQVVPPPHMDNLFFMVGDIMYLCGMKLHTKTSSLTVRQRRQLVQLVIDWMHINVGEKKWKYRTFDFVIRRLPDGYTPSYGCYDPTINRMFIFHNYCSNVKMLIRATLHEYTHYLQNLRYYHSTLMKVGYTRHPLEKQANVNERLVSWVWEDIKNLVP